MKNRMNRKPMVKMGFAFSALSASAMGGEAINVRCVRAGGYYGVVHVQEKGDRVEIYVKSGLAMRPKDLLEKLKLGTKGAFVSGVRITLPASACGVSPANSLLVTCHSREGELKFQPEQLPVQVHPLSRIKFSLAEATVDLGDKPTDGIKATLSVSRTLDDQQLTGVMQDVFGNKANAAHESCRNL